MSLERLDDPTRALIELAAAAATGSESRIDLQVKECRSRRVPPIWVDELLLQTVLICGWPRALTAARLWREQREGAPAEREEAGTDYRRHADWLVRGEQVCRTVYGEHYQALRRNIHALHPDLEAGMIVEGYGRILGRPGLTLARRELCTIAQIAVLGARRQLRSHLRGALNAGAPGIVVSETLELVRPQLDPAEWEAIALLWERARA